MQQNPPFLREDDPPEQASESLVRATSTIGDIRNIIFLPSDIHFYSDIYHDWPPERRYALTEKSFASLETGGRIIIREMLHNDDEAGPFAVAACGSCGTKSNKSPAALLSIEVKPTFGYWSIVTGRKPHSSHS